MAFALIIPQINNSNKLAFQRRDSKAPTDSNLLGLFGGSIEEGESPLEFASRSPRHILSEVGAVLVEKLKPTKQKAKAAARLLERQSIMVG